MTPATPATIGPDDVPVLVAAKPLAEVVVVVAAPLALWCFFFLPLATVVVVVLPEATVVVVELPEATVVVVVVVVVAGAGSVSVPVSVILKEPLECDEFAVMVAPLKLSVPETPAAAPVPPLTLADPDCTVIVLEPPLLALGSQALSLLLTASLKLPLAPVRVAVPEKDAHPLPLSAELEPEPWLKLPAPMSVALPEPDAFEIVVAPLLPFTSNVAVPE